MINHDANAEEKAIHRRARKDARWHAWMEVQPDTHKPRPRNANRLFKDSISFLGQSWGKLAERLKNILKNDGKPVPKMPTPTAARLVAAVVDDMPTKKTKSETVREWMEEGAHLPDKLEVRLGRSALALISLRRDLFKPVSENKQTVTYAATPMAWGAIQSRVRKSIEADDTLSGRDRKALKRALKTITKTMESESEG